MIQSHPIVSRLFTALLLGAGLHSAPLQADDLVDVFVAAKDNDAVVGAARASYQADKERLPQARSLLLPSIVASASTTKTETTIPGDDSLQSQILRKGYNDNGWNAQLRQPILNLSSWFGYNSAKAFVKASSFSLAAQEQDLIVRVAEAYLNILRTRDRLDTTNAEVTAVQRQLEQVQQRFDVGLVAITDVLESQAAYDAALVRQIQAETDFYISFETLRTLTGRDYDELATLSEQLPIVNPDTSQKSLVANTSAPSGNFSTWSLWLETKFNWDAGTPTAFIQRGLSTTSLVCTPTAQPTGAGPASPPKKCAIS